MQVPQYDHMASHNAHGQADRPSQPVRVVGWLFVVVGAIGTVVGYGIAFESFKIHQLLRVTWYPVPGILFLLLGFILLDKKKMEQLGRWWKRRRKQP